MQQEDVIEQVPEVTVKGKSSVNAELTLKPPTNFGKSYSLIAPYTHCLNERH